MLLAPAQLKLPVERRIIGRQANFIGAWWRMSDPLQAAEMPKLDAFDEEFGQEPTAIARERRRNILRRLVMLAVIVVGVGAIAALAFAWSSSDGRLRLEVKSITAPPQTGSREPAEREIDQLRRRVDELDGEIRQLREANQQADETIAALRAAQKDAGDQGSRSVYWYSDPATLRAGMAREPESAAVAIPAPRPPAPRRDARDARGRERSPPVPQ